MKLGQHNLNMQSLFFTNKNLNKNFVGNNIAKSLSTVVKSVNHTTDSVTLSHRQKVKNLVSTKETEKSKETETVKLGFSGVIDLSYEARLEKKIGDTYKHISGQADRMETMAEYLTVAEKYEEFANSEGISQSARENALATAANIKEYVATNLTTGSKVDQHMHKDDDAVFENFKNGAESGAFAEMFEEGGEKAISAQHYQDMWDSTVDAQKILEDAGVNLSVQDLFQTGSQGIRDTVGIPTDRGEFDKLSTSELKDLLLKASEIYQKAADTIKEVHTEMYGNKSDYEEPIYNSMNMSPEAVMNRLADSLQSMDGATLAGQLKGNLQSVEMVFVTGEHNENKVVINKLVVIDDVDVKLEQNQQITDNIKQDVADTELKKEILGEYFYK